MGNLHTHISFPRVLMMNVNLKIPHIYLQGHNSYKKKRLWDSYERNAK
jgi:hypothetical protein